MRQTVPLRYLRTGESGQVVEIHGPDRCIKSFSDIGLRKGSLVKILAAGEPALCLVGDSKVSVRACGDVEILIEVGTS